MTKLVVDRSNASAWVILKGDKQIATVQAYYTAKTVYVDVRDFTNPESGLQRGKASGYGYDKLTAALSGVTIDNHKLTDHCDIRQKKLKRGYFLASDKHPKGYKLANGRYFEKGKPDRINQEFIKRENRDQEIYGWQYYKYVDDQKVYIPETQLEWGYTDCYKESGLDYLTDLGYTVIKAL